MWKPKDTDHYIHYIHISFSRIKNKGKTTHTTRPDCVPVCRTDRHGVDECEPYYLTFSLSVSSCIARFLCVALFQWKQNLFSMRVWMHRILTYERARTYSKHTIFLRSTHLYIFRLSAYYFIVVIGAVSTCHKHVHSKSMRRTAGNIDETTHIQFVHELNIEQYDTLIEII